MSIRIRIETLLRERGLKWVDIYGQKPLQWHKVFASNVLNGKIIPPLWQRVALAKAFGVDSSVIWTEGDMIEYHKQAQLKGGCQNV